MVNYANSKVYKIVSAKTDEVYIGSTTKEYLSQRLSQHRKEYKRYYGGEDKANYNSSFVLIQHDDNQIVLIESYEDCKSKDELRAHEQRHIELHKPHAVNLYNAITNKAKAAKQYAAEHKDKIQAYQKQYNEVNKVALAAKREAFYEKNKTDIAEQMQEHRAANRHRYKCEACGFSAYARKDFMTHTRTKKHKLNQAEYDFDVEMDRLADISIFDD